MLLTFGIIQLPLWALYKAYKRPSGTVIERFKSLLSPTDGWGPSDLSMKKEWKQFKREKNEEIANQGYTPIQRILRAFVPKK